MRITGIIPVINFMILGCAITIVGYFREGERENTKVFGFERSSLGRKFGIFLVLTTILSMVVSISIPSQYYEHALAGKLDSLYYAILALVIGIYFSLHDFKEE